MTTWDTHNRHVLGLVREWNGERLVCLFNFTGEEQEVFLDGMEGEYRELLTGRSMGCDHCRLSAYEYIFARLQAEPKQTTV